MKWLNEAINVRNDKEHVQKSGAYEFNRAICNIKLAAERPDQRALDEEIGHDLEVVGTTASRYRDIAKRNPDVQRWLSQAQRGERGSVLSSILIGLVDGHESTTLN